MFCHSHYLKKGTKLGPEGPSETHSNTTDRAWRSQRIEFLVPKRWWLSLLEEKQATEFLTQFGLPRSMRRLPNPYMPGLRERNRDRRASSLSIELLSRSLYASPLKKGGIHVSKTGYDVISISRSEVCFQLFGEGIRRCGAGAGGGGGSAGVIRSGWFS